MSAKYCETCVHGFDKSVHQGSPVYCAPQDTMHAWNYGCTGYRKITVDELEERASAKYGAPLAATQAEGKAAL